MKDNDPELVVCVLFKKYWSDWQMLFSETFWYWSTYTWTFFSSKALGKTSQIYGGLLGYLVGDQLPLHFHLKLPWVHSAKTNLWRAFNRMLQDSCNCGARKGRFFCSSRWCLMEIRGMLPFRFTLMCCFLSRSKCSQGFILFRCCEMSFLRSGCLGSPPWGTGSTKTFFSLLFASVSQLQLHFGFGKHKVLEGSINRYIWCGQIEEGSNNWTAVCDNSIFPFTSIYSVMILTGFSASCMFPQRIWEYLPSCPGLSSVLMLFLGWWRHQAHSEALASPCHAQISCSRFMEQV